MNGNSVYMLRPTLRLVETVAAGSIAGMIDPTIFSAQTCSSPEAGYAVYVFAGRDVAPDDVDGTSPDPVTTAKATYDGQSYIYKAAFLEAGNYTVAATCQADLDDPAEGDADIAFVGAANVTITAGAETVYDFVAPTP